MSAMRVLVRLAFAAASAILLIWVVEGLTGTDGRESILPFLRDDSGRGVIIFVGVAWGLLLLTGAGRLVPAGAEAAGGVPAGARPRRGRDTAIAVATISSLSRTGLTVNDVPQYDIHLDVTPAEGEPFPARLRQLIPVEEAAALTTGSPLPVEYETADHGRIAVADPTEQRVRERLLRWRIDRGLIPADLVAARTSGVTSPASVLALRPTGRRREGQVEIELRLLVTPEDGGAPWEADTQAFVHPEALSRVQVGSPVFAMYQPHDPQTVAMTVLREEAAR
ncbi:hypothetical protein [Microbacterium marinilacus]|uniref:hypothetical protein n=1 Tax=Microbacterium marinilacus TaxID=415209 RepID=UPI001C8E55CE|nr:hypothetical protein [Microbacterium marinilacus]